MAQRSGARSPGTTSARAERAEHGALQGARHRPPRGRAGREHQRAPPRGVDAQVRRGVVVRGAVPRRRQGGAVQGARAMPEARRRLRVLRHHGRGRRGREGAEGFTDRNATTFMGRPSMYIDFIKRVGFKYVTWWDGSSHHLERYFRNMLSQIARQPPGDERPRASPTSTWTTGCQLAHRARGHPEGERGLRLGRLRRAGSPPEGRARAVIGEDDSAGGRGARRSTESRVPETTSPAIERCIREVRDPLLR